MGSPVINTREDLDALVGTPAYDTFIEYLKGSMTRKQNIAIYPDGYGMPGYEGDVVDPIWTDIEDLSTIHRFGFIKSEFK